MSSSQWVKGKDLSKQLKQCWDDVAACWRDSGLGSGRTELQAQLEQARPAIHYYIITVC